MMRSHQRKIKAGPVSAIAMTISRPGTERVGRFFSSLQGAGPRGNPVATIPCPGLLRRACHRARIHATRWRLWPWPSHDEEMDYFLLLGLWPAGVLPDENGEGVAPPFLRFLSAFGFFFSLLLRI